MSLSTSYSEFNQQLLLKLTLGQQFKQAVKVPNELQVYVPQQIDSAQDLLVLNQYWVLMQQAGYQAQGVPETIQKNMTKTAQVHNEKPLDHELVQILKWVVAQESPFLYQDWVNQILKLAQQQQQVIPRYLVLNILPLCRNPVLLASSFPEFAFQGDVTTRLDDVKRVWKYLKQQDSASLIRQLLKSKNSDWSLLMSQLCSQLPNFIHQHIAEFWSQSIQKNHLQSHAESLVTYNMPVTQFEALYQHVKTLEPQNAATVRNNAALSFYLYYQDNVLYNEVMALLRACLSYDAQAKKVKFNINLDQDDALNDYGFFDREANLFESRKSLKTAYQCAQVEQAYQAFCESSQGVLYLKIILIQLPLVYWLELFGTWDHLLSLHSQQKASLWNAFIVCCYREQRRDLALWFYQHQALSPRAHASAAWRTGRDQAARPGRVNPIPASRLAAVRGRPARAISLAQSLPQHFPQDPSPDQPVARRSAIPPSVSLHLVSRRHETLQHGGEVLVAVVEAEDDAS